MLKALAYIGANNLTGKVDIDVIKSVAIKHFPDGFSVQSSQGCWDGGHEDSVIVSRNGDASPDFRLRWDAFCDDVCVAAEQNAILVEYLQVEGGLRTRK